MPTVTQTECNTHTFCLKKIRPSRSGSSYWCGQQDSNLHGFPLEPKSNVSANSTMSAF